MDNNIVTKDNFIVNIKKWVSIDNTIQNLDNKKKELRLEKIKINQDLLNYFENNESLNNRVAISDGDIRAIERKEYTPLTFTFVEESLHKLINNNDSVEKIINYLRTNREIKIINEIKRTYK